METKFEQYIDEFNTDPLSANTLQQLIQIFQSKIDETLPLFVSQEYQSLIILEHKIWQLLSEDSQAWLNEPYFLEFLQTLYSFNKKIIFDQENIKDETKTSLILPNDIHDIINILEKVEQSTDDTDPFINYVSLWLENLSFLVHEYPQVGHSRSIIDMNHYITSHFLLSETFKFYITQLSEPEVSPSIFTNKQMFYMKTCSMCLDVYFYTNPDSFDYHVEEILENMGTEYLELLEHKTCTIESWNKELLSCIAHLIGFMRALLWWDGENGTKLKKLFPTEKILCDYICAIIRIIDYKEFYPGIKLNWINDETILIDSVLLFLMNIIQSQNIDWFFRSMTQLPGILLRIAEMPGYYRICLCAYGVLSEILTDEHLRALTFPDNIRVFVLKMIEEAWNSPLKKYKQIPLHYFLRGFANISKNDFVQTKMAQSKKISLFVAMCDEYPMVYDIIWPLSFNQDIQQQLRADLQFMTKLNQMSEQCDNEQLRKTLHGIMWNLSSCHQDHLISPFSIGNLFDIMISYSHKEKALCKQIYDELTKAGYRIWIDFDQMHGNVMDAMAQAIEQSTTVIICMSEQYRKSNYCRAEAQYAFQRERKIVPLLLQKHYKPNGWLLFLIGQLLYVDFNKYEFPRAMEMLFKELKTGDKSQNQSELGRSKEDISMENHTASVSSPTQIIVSMGSSSNILEWTKSQVHNWLLEQNLVQMSRLLKDCNGRSLIYLSKYMKNCSSQQVLNILEADALRSLNEHLSLIELSRFHSLMDEHKKSLQSAHTRVDKKDC